MPFSVPERDQSRGEHTPAAPQVDAVRFPAAEATPWAGTGAPRAAGTGPRRAPTGLRPSRVPVVQPKLRLGGESDHHEREADRLAEGLAAAATAATADRAAAAASVTPVGGSAGQAIDPAAQQVILDARGQGQPLPAGQRGRYERGLGADLSSVRLHTDRQAGDLNQRFGSSAFTTGNDIFFGRGEYNTASDAGQAVLTHELVHVAQQGGGGTLVQRVRKKAAKTPAKPRRKLTTRRGSAPKKSKAKEEDLDFAEMEIEKAEAEDEGSDFEPARKKRGAGRGRGSGGGKPKKARINIKAFDREEMETYLEGHDLAMREEYEEPDPVLVGAVVWNINHLKGGDDQAAKARAAKAKAAESAPATYDTEDILAALGSLQSKLQDEDLIAGLTLAALDAKQQHPGKEYTAARTEISQFMRDIGELRRIKPVDLIEIGTEALEMSAARGEHQDIEVRARELEWIRGLDRVWNRLVRLRVVLFTGKVEGTAREASRTAIREALDEAGDAGAEIEADIETLLKLIKPSVLEQAVSRLKEGSVVKVTTEDFFKQPAVNLVLINEMNLGIGHLRSATKDDPNLGLSEGPVMLAKGQPLPSGTKSRARVTTGTGKTKQGVGGKQYEYYPALYRTGTDNDLKSKGTFYVTTEGDFAPQDEKENQAIPWDKAKKTFRGIVVHRFEQNGQEFWAGVLHTTPAGKDLDRRKIWPQIETALTELNALARTFKVPLLVGGDFYIPAEGIVTDPSPEQRAAMTTAEQDVLERAKAWSLVRNIFLKAVQDNRLDELFGKLGLKADEEVAPVAKQPMTAYQRTVDFVRKAWNLVGYPYPDSEETAPATEEPAQSMEVEEKAPAPERAATSPYQPAAGILKPQHTRLWDRYKEAVTEQFERPDFGDEFDPKAILQLLAPGTGFDNVMWSKTLAGGDITPLDIIRNSEIPVGDEFKALTMQRVLDPLGYHVVEGGNPTNPKEHGRGENKTQLADLFIANEYWNTTRSGIVTPDDAELKSVDSPGQGATKTYTRISDHAPVAMLGSTKRNDPRVYSAFHKAPGADERAVQANLAAWDRMGQRLKGLASSHEPVEDQVKDIKRLLGEPAAGPTSRVIQVRRLTVRLIQSISDANYLTAELKALLAELGQWRDAYYTTDVAE
jgi:Domain of unknown function (DUF4157)